MVLGFELASSCRQEMMVTSLGGGEIFVRERREKRKIITKHFQRCIHVLLLMGFFKFDQRKENRDPKI